MIEAGTVRLTIREREWLALMEERCRERGYVLVGLARSRDGLALGLGDIVLCDEEDGDGQGVSG